MRGGVTRPVGEKLRLAVIGVAGQGLWDLQQFLKTDAAVVALCDVDEQRAGEARALCPHARFFVDYREMLDKAGKEFDAVVVATPDHTHAHVTMAALQAGKHVYCEKPLTHCVWEARQVMTAARKYGRATQMGIQMHAGRNYRRVVELIQAGTIGPVREVHAWCPTVWSGKGTGLVCAKHPAGDPPSAVANESCPPPAGLHWDLWLGPAPQRPYADKAYVPAAWRGWWDFGGGGHEDMACHFLDLAYWALDLGHPKTIEAAGPPVDADSAPPWLIVRYEYGQDERARHGSDAHATATGGMPVPTPRASLPVGEGARRDSRTSGGDKPAVKLTWSVGAGRPDKDVKETMPAWKEGVLFVGEKGMLVADFNRFELLPAGQFPGCRRAG